MTTTLQFAAIQAALSTHGHAEVRFGRLYFRARGAEEGHHVAYINASDALVLLPIHARDRVAHAVRNVRPQETVADVVAEILERVGVCTLGMGLEVSDAAA